MSKRAGAYWGLHFDFHAIAATKGIGTRTVAEKIGAYLDATHPDYIQLDTKGHPGYTSFFSDYGDVAPGLEVDHLKIFREETAKRGILMIAHHSGIWDTLACEEHPEWRAIRKDGTTDPNFVEPNSAYVDQKLIPQLKELAGKYGFDGAWIDGDSWGVIESYRPEVVDEFLKCTGFSCIEDAGDSPSRLAFRQYWRERYEDYLRHVIREVKKDYPHFEMTMNFTYSVQMPLKPIPEMDFLSGDVSALAAFRTTSRCFVHQGKPWDIMSWAAPDFAPGPDGANVGIAQKSVTRLCREAAQVLSFGGGYQIVNNMTSKGEIRMSDLAHMEQLSRFVLDRKPWCNGCKPIDNPAILYSYEDTRWRIDRFWTREQLFGINPSAMDFCNAILDGGRPVDMLFDYHVLEDKIGNRKTLILPEIQQMSDEMEQKLLDFVRKGGNLLVIGADASQRFAADVDISVTTRGKELVYMEEGGYLYGYFDDLTCFDPNGCTELVPAYTRYMDTDVPRVTTAVWKTFGLGKIALLGWNLLSNYRDTRRFSERNTLRRILDFLDPAPTAYLESGIPKVDIIPAEKGGQLLVHLVNTAEYYYDVYGSGSGEIPPIYDLCVAVRTDRAPRSVKFQPEGKDAEYSYDGKYLHVKVPKLEVHTILVIE